MKTLSFLRQLQFWRVHPLQKQHNRRLHRERSGAFPVWSLPLLPPSPAGIGAPQGAAAAPGVKVQDGAESAAFVQVRCTLALKVTESRSLIFPPQIRDSSSSSPRPPQPTAGAAKDPGISGHNFLLL